jgi:hypothetical protein
VPTVVQRDGADKRQKSARQLEYHKLSVSGHKTAKINKIQGCLVKGGIGANSSAAPPPNPRLVMIT